MRSPLSARAWRSRAQVMRSLTNWHPNSAQRLGPPLERLLTCVLRAICAAASCWRVLGSSGACSVSPPSPGCWNLVLEFSTIRKQTADCFCGRASRASRAASGRSRPSRDKPATRRSLLTFIRCAAFAWLREPQSLGSPSSRAPALELRCPN